MSRRARVVAVAAGLLLLSAGLFLALRWAQAYSQRPVSIVLVTIDTLRADHLSAYGYPGTSSPSLVRLAERGTLFSWALSPAPYTVPSHAALLTGRYPSFLSTRLGNGRQKLVAREETLAEILSDNGFATAAVVSNSVLRRHVGLDQGFETYVDTLPDREKNRSVRERRADKTIDVALRLLEDLGDGPYFLWVHLQDPHGPYTPPADVPVAGPMPANDTILPVGPGHSGYRAVPAYQRLGASTPVSDYVRSYDREIRFADRELARLLTALEEREAGRRDLLLVTADHGEAMGDDEFWFAHSHSVALDQVHVPLIIAGDGIRSGATVAKPVSTINLFATILDFAGLPRPARSHSTSLLPTLRWWWNDPPATGGHAEGYSQRGTLVGDVWFTSDRRPAHDEAFWRKSPISGGTVLPLGERAYRLLDSGAHAIPPPPLVRQAHRGFDERAEHALIAGNETAETTPLTAEEKDALRALGYVE